MGKTAADVQREIEKLRNETDLLVAELGSKMRDAVDARSQVRRHPAVAVGAGLALLSGLSFAGYAIYTRVQRERRPSAPFGRRDGGVKVAVFNNDVELGRPKSPEIEEGGFNAMLKRILYAAITAAVVGFASFLARRMAESIWVRTMEERPPREAR